MSDGLFRGFDKIPYYMVIWYTKQIKYFPEEKKEKSGSFMVNLHFFPFYVKPNNAREKRTDK